MTFALVSLFTNNFVKIKYICTSKARKLNLQFYFTNLCTIHHHSSFTLFTKCLACDDNCTGILLDTVAMLSEELAGGTSHIAEGYIPPPWEELSYIDSNVTAYLEEFELRTQLQQRMKNVPWHEYKKLAEDVETMLRNVCYSNISK